ncbi:MAG: type II CRISPR-associated endonuclease Cas1 [Phycisphaerae bacterium]|nr:type II CRISPR-associated endonuclease Cas1 [Phycisphaerae bacterium]
MLRRTVEVSREPAHITVRDNQLLILRKTDPPKTLPANPPNLAGSIPIEDIGMVVIDEPQTTYSHAALNALAEQGAAVVVCGRDHMPSGILLAISQHNEIVWRLDDQLGASRPLQKQMWRRIIIAKILAQMSALPDEAILIREKLAALAREVKSGDTENHEAQAARLYWEVWIADSPSQLARDFRRDTSPGKHAECPNNFLNYGYAVLRASVARALVGAGLLTALGIKHRHRANAFCLADDLMEPLRPVIDRTARELFLEGARDLTQPAKGRLLLTLTATATDSSGSGPISALLPRYAASLAESFARGEDHLDIPEIVPWTESRPPRTKGAQPSW